MAKQTGDIIIEGTIDDITFYKMEGKYYARRKSSLKGSRVKKDPRFKRTMESAERMARGSQLASKVYRSLSPNEQVYGLFKELKSTAIRALKEGKSEAEVLIVLQQLAGKTHAPVSPVVMAVKKILRIRTIPSFTKPLFRLRNGRKKKVLDRKRRHPRSAEVLKE